MPVYVTFDLGMVASHILRLPTKHVQLQYSAPGNFWDTNFRMDIRPFHRGPGNRVFDGTFMTDGYGVSILKRCNAAGKGAGKK